MTHDTPPLADEPLWRRLPRRPVTPDEIAAALPRTVPGDYMAVSAPTDEFLNWGRLTRMLVETNSNRYHALCIASESWMRAETVTGQSTFEGAVDAIQAIEMSGFTFLPTTVVVADREAHGDGYTPRTVWYGRNDSAPLTGTTFLNTRRDLADERAAADEAADGAGGDESGEEMTTAGIGIGEPFVNAAESISELSSALSEAMEVSATPASLGGEPVAVVSEVEQTTGPVTGTHAIAETIASVVVTVRASDFQPVGHPSPVVKINGPSHPRAGEAEVTYEGPVDAVAEAMAADYGTDLEFGPIGTGPVEAAYEEAVCEKRGEAVAKAVELLDSGSRELSLGRSEHGLIVGPEGEGGVAPGGEVAGAAPDPGTFEETTVSLRDREAIKTIAEHIREEFEAEVPRDPTRPGTSTVPRPADSDLSHF